MAVDLRAFQRSYLSDHVVSYLSDAGLRVGDGLAPEDGGWDGPPDADSSSYSPYITIIPGTGSDATGPIGSSIADITSPYIITGYGLSRRHVERYMDKVADVLVAMDRTIVVLGDSSWKLQQTRRDSIGGVSRNDSIEPSEFSQSDVYIVYISKEL